MSYDLILVDGYSITHTWPDLLKLQKRSFSAARDALVSRLAAYAAHSGNRVAVVFDGTKQKIPVPSAPTPRCEVVFSPYGQTADEVIERHVASLKNPATVLVVTDDAAERMTVESFGAFSISADTFHSLVEREIGELDRTIKKVQSHAKTRFRRHT